MIRLDRIDPARAGRIVDLVAILLAISVALALAALTWRIIAGGPGAHVAAAPPPQVYAATDVAPVVQLAPFGAPGAAGAASGPTSLPLILKAIIYRASPGVSTAIIAAAGQPAKAFKVGDSAGGLAAISAIERDHVVVDAGGQLQQLFFPGRMKELLGQAQAGGAPLPPPAPSPPAPDGAVQAPSLPVAPPPASPPAPPSPGAQPQAAPTAIPPGRQGAFLDSSSSAPTSRPGANRLLARLSAQSSNQIQALR
ncbi:MAG: hypothetical protein DI623_00940 [Sphingomonas sanxanigenens]|uniref:Type II secretion system protein GspC N-terminal domain-containing protein n=1 Tax=Sphingomonas sanxanigenens TaxID=397260 RepID=A0A2W5AIC9_9SPHN|nr:MAG: hypothetical protein DI623_00940 [Sphingomonas sanxanigenens]